MSDYKDMYEDKLGMKRSDFSSAEKREKRLNELVDKARMKYLFLTDFEFILECLSAEELEEYHCLVYHHHKIAFEASIEALEDLALKRIEPDQLDLTSELCISTASPVI